MSTPNAPLKPVMFIHGLWIHSAASEDHTVPEVVSRQAYAQLRHEWPTFTAFALSFFVVGVIWVNHHALFALVAKVDRTVMFLNLLLLMWVTTIPFSTSALAGYLRTGGADTRVAVLLYGISNEGMAISFTLILRPCYATSS